MSWLERKKLQGAYHVCTTQILFFWLLKGVAQINEMTDRPFEVRDLGKVVAVAHLDSRPLLHYKAKEITLFALEEI